MQTANVIIARHICSLLYCADKREPGQEEGQWLQNDSVGHEKCLILLLHYNITHCNIKVILNFHMFEKLIDSSLTVS